MSGPRIERVDEVRDGAVLTVPATDAHYWAIDARGRIWLRKREVVTGCEPLLAEAIGWMLAQLTGVPVPHAAVIVADEERSWLSEQVPAVVHWSPRWIDSIANLDDLGRILALDAVIGNGDRHRGNLLLQPVDSEESVRLWSIDVGNALVGCPRDFAAAIDDLPAVHNLARGLPIAAVSSAAAATAHLLETVTADDVADIVREACEIAREPEVALLTEALQARCAGAARLVARYLALLGAVS